MNVNNKPDSAQCPEQFTGLSLESPKQVAVGMAAVTSSLKHVFGQAGVVKGTKALRVLNQKGGVDCPSCAWPDPDEHRAMAEFCENGAKAIAFEADQRRMSPELFKKYSVAELAAMSDYEHGQLGRLTHPMILRKGETHYQPIEWAALFNVVASELKSLPTPDDAIFYTSGRTSNEAAFLYQLFIRHFGTNNLPDCSNMCHESSGAALNSMIGIGKGTVTLDDFEKSELILILGQNPGTNHPRMLTALQKAKRNGAKIIAINPLKEAGLLNFRNPQEITSLFGISQTQLADEYLQVKIGCDQILLQLIAKRIIEKQQIDSEFVRNQTIEVDALYEHVKTLDEVSLLAQTGITKNQLDRACDLIGKSSRIIACWAMGLTQHKNSVSTIQDLVNIILLRGSIGKAGAGLCPVRGHSNVQGDRTMGIYEHPPQWTFKLGERFQFKSPKNAGYDTVAAIRAMRDQPGKLFFAMGGNFLSATPDTTATGQALRNCRLTAHVSIKLNRSHLVCGETALILPCLGRTEQDDQQFVTTENSMGVVQMSKGTLPPASPHLLSEPAIVARLATAVFGQRSAVPWNELVANYDNIRDLIEQTIPGFEEYNRKVRQPGGFYLPNVPRTGKFQTESQKAKFVVNKPTAPIPQADQFVMMTIRTHDQFNTTVYGLDDRYRGIKNERRVVLINEADISRLGLNAGDIVDLTSHFQGETRVANKFIVVNYDIPGGNIATYFPETNVLVPLESKADISHTPTSKSIYVTIKKHSS